MSNKEKQDKKASRTKSIVLLLVYLAFMVGCAIYFSLAVDQNAVQQAVRASGSFGIALFFIIELVYVTFTPLFNTFILIAAGYLYGGLLGLVLNFFATACGLFLIVFLVKKYGQPLLEKLVSPSYYRKYDSFVKRAGPITLLVCYVLPFTPDDELTYLVAAGHLPFKQFIIPIILGTLAKAAYSYIGALGTPGITIALWYRVGCLAVGVPLILLQNRFLR